VERAARSAPDRQLFVAAERKAPHPPIRRTFSP
jgi:hypothetical protein